jgi:transposase
MQKARYFIGIDRHKTVLQVCVLDGHGRVVEEFRLHLDGAHMGQQVIARLTRWRTGGRLVVGAVGCNRWFVNGWRAAGLTVVVAHAAKLGLAKLGKKTDRRDAYELARRLFLGDIERHAATYYAADEEYGVRKVERVRHKLVAIRQQVVNQIRGLLNASLLPAPGTSLYSARSLAALKGMTLPTPDLTLCLQTLVSALTAVQAQSDRLPQTIRERAAAPAVQQFAAHLPNVGPQTALTLHAELGDLSRFRGARQVSAYVGLAPRVANSADTRHHGRVTKRGNPELRWIVSQWAVRLLARGEPRVLHWAASRLRRMHKNKVRLALARRLLVGLYVSHRRGEAFSLDRCLAA